MNETGSARCAVGLDIGSNTFSCAEVVIDPSGAPLVVKDTSRAVRLSEDLLPGGRLKQSAVARGLDTLLDLVRDFDMAKKPFRVVATAALRMTSHPRDFTDPAKEILGMDLEIIDGAGEALLVSRGAVLDLEPSTDGAGWIIVDVGGQSTEVCASGGTAMGNPVSMPLGVVGLTLRFLKDDPPTAEQISNLEDYVFGQVSEVLPRNPAGRILGVAGTATTLGMLELGLTKWDRTAVHGLEISRSASLDWQKRMTEIDARSRQERFRIKDRRADVFPAGLCVINTLLKYFERDVFTVSANGLRIGAALSILKG